MAKKPKKTKYKYSISLAKPNCKLAEFLTATARQSIADGKAIIGNPKPGIGAESIAYAFSTKLQQPSWYTSAQQLFDLPKRETNSLAGVLLFHHKDRTFAITYGHGHAYLDDGKIVNDFGIRVVVNSVSDKKLKSLEKANLTSAMRDYAQSGSRSRLLDFGVRDEYDLVKRITGKTGDEEMDDVSGSSSLRLTSAFSLGDARQLAEDCLELYNADTYKQTEFRIIDELREIKDRGTIAHLDDLLVGSIKNKEEDFELCLPELTYGEIGQVKIAGTGGLRGTYPDISMETYRRLLGNSLEDLSHDDLLEDRVTLVDDSNNINGSWSIRRCVIGSIEDNASRYVAHEGDWYLPSERIYGAVTKYFIDRLLPHDPALTPLIQKNLSTGKIPQVRYEREEDYNKRIAHASGYILFDQEEVALYANGPHDLEMCDLYDAELMRFIHVKKSSRTSPTLTYLFEQGRRAAEHFRANDHVRNSFLELLEKKKSKASAQKLKKAQPNEIAFEFWISDYPRPDGNFNIPFLSRVALKTKGTAIESFGYKTGVGFIPQTPPV